MKNNCTNLTANVWANLDNPIKSFDFSKFMLISCMPPSQVRWHSATICDITTVYLMELAYTNVKKKILFMKIHLPSTFRLMLECIYDWTWSTGLLISKKNYKFWNFMYRVNGQLFLNAITDSGSSILRGRHTKLCIISSLKWIIQICFKFYCWVLNFTVGFQNLLSTRPIHIVWGNFPFNFVSCLCVITHTESKAVH